MTKKNDLVLVDDKYLKNKIYIIRGQKVMLDRDLAEIYGYSTMAFNQQVQRNIEKFYEDFMFQLTKEEYNNLMCKNYTSSLYKENLISQNVISRSLKNSEYLKSQNATSSWAVLENYHLYSQKKVYIC